MSKELDNAENARLAGDYNHAKLSYEQIIADANETDLTKAHAMRGMAEVNRMLENIDDANRYYSKALEFYKELENENGVGFIYLGIGQLERHENKINDAIQHIRLAKENLKKPIINMALQMRI